ncbi:FecR family protein [Chitinophaga niabensis]|uniref:Ferric-dicitrate binding protein FerR, regulates iron transport through sigma-19 n=1 Tax=Chitinophaga niabensis TaxID=536979 RepID=A0A1N6DAQ1_9BACT|nr:FecR family protein [Chitinophaga niabensis]SIN67882.1 ferric-dicitrate binding protein FerR, regulates iron transport through sigma-19 [Chitinophaga niabensis]
MSYSQQELEALLQNDEFISWVLSTRPEENVQWQNWVQQHPDREAMVKMIRSIREAEKEAANSHDLADQIWHDLQSQLETPVRQMNWRRYIAVAAVITLLAAGAWWFTGMEKTEKKGLLLQKASKHELIAKNTGSSLQTLYLLDGTRITLSPKSTLHYSRLMSGNKREVSLEGEAFFEVARDANRPFYVYSGNIITKVLGTSFRVKGDEQIVVAVRSGKVAVSRKESTTEQFILLPNEQVIFNTRQNTLQKLNVTDVAILANPVPAPAVLNYDEAPVGDVLDSLAKMYAVDIQYNHSLFAKCRVTVALDQESLYEKLTVLCKVVGANYEIIDEAINITGQGCN